MENHKIKSVVDKLQKVFGTPHPPRVTDVFEMVLYENVAYLVDDEHRDLAFENLKKVIGTRPIDILTASPEQFERVSKLAGSNKRGQVQKMLRAAEIAQGMFAGDPAQILQFPTTRARAALKQFPAIGDPGAEKILLFNKAAAVLPLDSNGLRVLTRIGFAEEQASYAATYRAVQQAVAKELPSDHDWLIRAHQILRKHGQSICKRKIPLCEKCPVFRYCRHANR